MNIKKIALLCLVMIAACAPVMGKDNFGENNNKKNESSWFSRNWKIVVGGLAVVCIGAYLYRKTLCDFYNSAKAFIKSEGFIIVDSPNNRLRKYELVTEQKIMKELGSLYQKAVSASSKCQGERLQAFNPLVESYRYYKLRAMDIENYASNEQINKIICKMMAGFYSIAGMREILEKPLCGCPNAH